LFKASLRLGGHTNPSSHLGDRDAPAKPRRPQALTQRCSLLLLAWKDWSGLPWH
jgi:hypothetical protein